MSSQDKRSGSCLCSAVSFTAQIVSPKVGVCHCNMCRKWGGSSFMEVSCGREIVFKGEDNIAVYNSSGWAERGFCSKCGTHLFCRIKETQEHQLPVGLLDDQNELRLDTQYFIDVKPSFYSFSNKTNDMTRAEVFAKYAPPAE